MTIHRNRHAYEKLTHQYAIKIDSKGFFYKDTYDPCKHTPRIFATFE